MYGRVCDWHTLEGPCVLKYEGRYYCFYSGGCWQTDTYGVDYVVANSVMGPYTDEDAADQPRVLQTVSDRVIWPGHCSIVLGPDHRTYYIVYHAWDDARTARRMCIDPLEFTPKGPRCRGPSWEERTIPVLAKDASHARHA